MHARGFITGHKRGLVINFFPPTPSLSHSPTLHSTYSLGISDVQKAILAIVLLRMIRCNPAASLRISILRSTLIPFILSRWNAQVCVQELQVLAIARVVYPAALLDFAV